MIYFYTFLGVVIFNTIPFFVPATWTVISFIAATNDVNVFYLAFIATVGATIGRILLAEFSRTVIRSRFLTVSARTNIDSLRVLIEERKKVTMGAFLLYAFGPLPSNYLFIAYGLTKSPIYYLAVPFFFGRLASYTFWVYIGTQFAEAIRTNSLFSGYFIFSQIVTISLVYWFTKVNWKKIVSRWI
jgi:hypothetical protein